MRFYIINTRFLSQLITKRIIIKFITTVKCKNFKFHRINKLINSYNKYNYCAKNAHKKCYQGAGAELED